jgi:phosphonate utilization associated putative membrane protein
MPSPYTGELSGVVIAAVLCGALLHAGWNALVKSSRDKTLDTALVHFLAGLAVLPFALTLGPPRSQSWPFIAGSMVIHLGYYVALAGAYRHGDLGLTYPVMRGGAPLLVALSSLALVGERLGMLAWLGVTGIAGGVALVGLGRTSHLLEHRRALAYALANAAIIAAYTVIDGLGARSSGDVLRYVLWLFVADGLPFGLLVAWQRGVGGRREMLIYARGRWPRALAGGLASVGSYGVALWAMTRAPVAHIAALRETSVLFAAVIGWAWLGERFGARRMAGTLAIVGGVMALRLG